MREVQIVAAIVRREGEILMVRQAGPGEEPHWSIPGGRVEAGESPAQALARELEEETGLTLIDAGALAYSVRRADPTEECVYSISTWEVAAWAGKLRPSDPDGFVLEAAWVPVGEAVERLARVPWLEPLASFLRES